MTWLSVALAGALGASLRYAVGVAVGARAFPWATLGINVTGSFLLAFLVTGPLAGRLSTPGGIAVTVGLLGAFTTFSTFGWETVALVQDGRGAAAATYVAGSVLLGLAGAGLGHWLGRLTSG